MKAKLILIGLLCIFTGCSKGVLIPATYVEKHDKNVVLFVSEEYKFKEGNKFEYQYWSDNLSSSKYGIGNYQIKDDKLVLEFTDEFLDWPKSALVSKKISVADSSKKFFRVQVKTHSGVKLPGVNVILTNQTNDTIAGTSTDENGAAEIILSEESTPAFLKFSFFAHEDMLLEVNPNENLDLVVVLSQLYGERITNKKLEKRIKIKNNSIMIDNKAYESATVAENK